MMKRLFFAMVAFVFATSFSFAQEQPAPQAEPSHLVLPMFGNKAKTDAEQREDEKFLTSCDKNFTNRTEASKFFMERGWEYLNEGQVDTAMYRFNLAWLLNPDNKDTYWAFGLVTAGKGQIEEAINLYERALKYDGNNSLLLSDIGSSYLTLYTQKNKKKLLKQANSYLSKSLATDSTNAYALYNFSKIKFYEKKYADAWEYLHKGRQLNMASFDYLYLTELLAAMPDPQGFFNSNTGSSTSSSSK